MRRKLFVQLLEVFLVYLLISLVLSTIIRIIPEPIRTPFEELVLNMRRVITRYINSIFGQEDNFEVNLLSRLIAPFIVLLFIFAMLATITVEGNYEIIDTYLWIVNIFILVFIAPTSKDVQRLLDNRSETIFVFILKLVVILQILELDLVHGDLITVSLAIFPVSVFLPYDLDLSEQTSSASSKSTSRVGDNTVTTFK